MPEGLRFRWLGAAGIELEFGGERLLIDPYLSRVPLRYLFFGRPASNRPLVVKHLAPARAVLITHPHFDHLLDVPTVCRDLGAKAYGSPNAARLLAALGVPNEKIQIAFPGDNYRDGPFSIEVFAGEHIAIARIIPHTGRLPKELTPPLKLRDYRMDAMYSFRISSGGQSILVWNSPASGGAPEADCLVLTRSRRPESWKAVIAQVKPKTILLIHWDNFFAPLTKPLRPMLAPPRWGRPLFPRMDPHEFARSVTKTFPEIKVLTPDIFLSVVFPSTR